MSAAVVSGWGSAAVAVASPSSCSKLEASVGATGRASSAAAAQRLIPVVGLVNRTKERRLLRWQQQQPERQESARAGRQQGAAQAALKAVSVNESQFDVEVLQSSVPVLVDFWASWCGPCRLMGLTLDWAAQEYDGKVKCVKIETDGNPGLVEKYDVYGLPTLMLFVDGKMVPNTHREGALTKEKLQAYLQANVPTIAATA